jgi:lipopolysaccharide biosynthesis glycosyltransferase
MTGLYAVGMCIDEAYLLPAMVTLTSLADSMRSSERKHVALRILTEDLSCSHAATMHAFTTALGFRSFAVGWRRPPRGVRIVEGASYISSATYLRFQLGPSFVRCPHLLYLDADVLVLGDVAAPFADLPDGFLAAVRDEFNYTVGACPALPGVVERWPMLRGRPYFNAGMLWLPTALMPTIRTAVARVLARHRRHILFNDQDALNLWLLSTGRVRPVAGRLNRFELGRFLENGDWVRRVVRRDVRSADVSVLHFVGPLKPWLRVCPTTEGVRLYRSWLRETTRQLRRLGDRGIDVDRDGGSEP